MIDNYLQSKIKAVEYVEHTSNTIYKLNKFLNINEYHMVLKK